MVDLGNGADVSFERLLRLRALAVRGADRSARTDDRAGGLSGRKRGMGLDIHDLRQFAEGDDHRHLDAAATARTGKAHIRTFHEEQEKAALLVADFRAPMFWGTRRRLRSVAAAEALAVAGWRMADAGGKVGLLTLRDGESDYLPPRLRETAMMRIAGALERAHRQAFAAARGAGGSERLDSLLERAGRLAGAGSALIVATGLDRPGPDLANVAGALRRKLRLTVLHVRDAVESAPPKGVFPYLCDGGPARWGRFGDGRPGAAFETLERLGAEICVIDAAADDEAFASAVAGG